MAKIDFNRVITAEDLRHQKLEHARQDAVHAVMAAIEAAMMRHTAQVPVAEMLSWGAKELAARAVLSDPEAEPDALLLAEAAVTGEGVADLSLRIVVNAEAQRAIVSLLTGLRRKALAGIAAASEVEAIAAVLKTAIAQIEAA